MNELSGQVKALAEAIEAQGEFIGELTSFTVELCSKHGESGLDGAIGKDGKPAVTKCVRNINGLTFYYTTNANPDGDNRITINWNDTSMAVCCVCIPVDSSHEVAVNRFDDNPNHAGWRIAFNQVLSMKGATLKDPRFWQKSPDAEAAKHFAELIPRAMRLGIDPYQICKAGPVK